MNCNQAKPLIDERVEANRTGDARSKNKPGQVPRAARPPVSKLDAHLAACASCAAEYQALLLARALPRTVATDTPADEEIKSMWTAIASAAALPAGQSVPVDDTTPTWWKTNQGWLLRFLTASTAAAAVLLFAASIGQNALGPRGNYGIDLVGGTRLAAADAVAPLVLQHGGHTEFYDFKNLSRDAANISYGYQVPFGPASLRSEDASTESREQGEVRFSIVGDRLAEAVAAARAAPTIYHDGNGSGQYAYGSAEPFSTATAQSILDFDGAPRYRIIQADGDQQIDLPESGLLATNGSDSKLNVPRAYWMLSRSGDVSVDQFTVPDDDKVDNAGDGQRSDGPSYAGGMQIVLDSDRDAWKPGERYLDVDRDGRWDAYDEAANWMDIDNKRDDAEGLLASAEFKRDESHFFFENESRQRDRWYFWSFGDRWDAADEAYEEDSSDEGQAGSDSGGGGGVGVPAFNVMLADGEKQYPEAVSDGPTVLEHAVGAPSSVEIIEIPDLDTTGATTFDRRLASAKEGRSEDVRMDIEASKIPWWETLMYPDDWVERISARAKPAASRSHVLSDNQTEPEGFSGRAVSPPAFTGLARIAPADAVQAEVQVPAGAKSVEDQAQAPSDQQTSTQSDPDEAKSPAPDQRNTQGPAALQPVEQQPAPPQTQRRTRPPANARPKIIKTGELRVEVESYEAAVERVLEIVSRANAFLADGSTTEQAGGALVGVMVIRVVPEQFEELFSLLKKRIGQVESENVKAADVTAQFVDLQARIRGLEMTEVRLQQLIQDKSFLDDVQSLLEVEREVTRVRVQIEQMQGQLRVMADRIGMSTIRITIREPARTVPSASMSVEIPVLDFAARTLGDALRSSGGRLVSAKTAKRNDGTLKGDYELEVSLAKFGDMLTAIESLGRVAQREVKDRQFSDASAPWAAEVKCRIGLLLYERSRQLPSGTISVEIEDLDAAIAAMNPALGKANATVVSNDTTQRSDGSSRAELRLRIPAGAYAEFVEALAPLGRTTAKKISGEAGSIVGGAADVLCNMTLTLSEPILQVPSGRILIEVAAFPDARKRLSVIVAGNGVQVLASDSEQRSDGTWVGGFRLEIKASEMEQIVSQLEALGRVESRQIRGIGLGDLARVDPKSIGVVTLTLAEKAAIRPPVNQAGGAIRAQLRGALAGLYKSLGYILYGLIVLAPWLVIVTAIGWLTSRAWKRRKQKAEA